MQNLWFWSLLSKDIKIKMYRTLIWPVVSYGCEAWSPTLGKEHRLRVFENGGLRKIFAPKRDKVTGEWTRRITRNFMICCLGDEIENCEMVRICGTYGGQGFGGETSWAETTWKT